MANGPLNPPGYGYGYGAAPAPQPQPQAQAQTTLDGAPLSPLNAMVLGPAPAEATSALYTVLAQALGMAMQNIVAQQQTMLTINNAIATKAMNVLAETNPEKALQAVQQNQGNLAMTADQLQRIYNVILNPTTPQPTPPPPPPPAPPPPPPPPPPSPPAPPPPAPPPAPPPPPPPPPPPGGG